MSPEVEKKNVFFHWANFETVTPEPPPPPPSPTTPPPGNDSSCWTELHLYVPRHVIWSFDGMPEKFMVPLDRNHLCRKKELHESNSPCDRSISPRKNNLVQYTTTRRGGCGGGCDVMIFDFLSALMGVNINHHSSTKHVFKDEVDRKTKNKKQKKPLEKKMFRNIRDEHRLVGDKNDQDQQRRFKQ